MTETISVRTTEPDYVVQAEATRIGPDILVYVWGGDRPHIGAVAAAQARPSLSDAAKTSATASVLAYVGHKEDGVAKEMAEAISSHFATNTVVTAGIHWDNLPAEGIQIIVNRCREITHKVIDGLE
jgi:predicted nucleotide-binding protein